MAQYAVTATELVIPVNNGNAPNGNNVTVSVIPGLGTTGAGDPAVSYTTAVTDDTATFYFLGRKSSVATFSGQSLLLFY